MPGDATPAKAAAGAPTAGAGPSAEVAGYVHGTPGNAVGAGASASAGKRRDSFARRLSLSGRPALGSSTIVVPQEAASERQS